MTATKTRQVDAKGNVTYTIRHGDTVIGTIHKTCSGYQAELPSGSYIPTSSIKKATALLEQYAA